LLACGRLPGGGVAVIDRDQRDWEDWGAVSGLAWGDRRRSGTDGGPGPAAGQGRWVVVAPAKGHFEEKI